VRPTLSRLRRDQADLATDLGRLKTQNAVVAALADRYVDLLARTSAQLAGLTSEQEALRREYEHAVH
jgi:carbohydrate-binding DOMON domain-containing protein